MKRKKKSILLNLSEGRYEKITKIAKEKEKTITAIIEEAIDFYIEHKLKVNDGFDLDKELNLTGETKLW